MKWWEKCHKKRDNNARIGTKASEEDFFESLREQMAKEQSFQKSTGKELSK